MAKGTTDVVVHWVDLAFWVADPQVVNPRQVSEKRPWEGNFGLGVGAGPIVNSKTVELWPKATINNRACLLVGLSREDHTQRAEVNVAHEEQQLGMGRQGIGAADVLGKSGLRGWHVFQDGGVVAISQEVTEIRVRRGHIDMTGASGNKNTAKVTNYSRIHVSLREDGVDSWPVPVRASMNPTAKTNGRGDVKFIMEKTGSEHATPLPHHLAVGQFGWNRGLKRAEIYSTGVDNQSLEALETGVGREQRSKIGWRKETGREQENANVPETDLAVEAVRERILTVCCIQLQKNWGR
eukprot:scaffold7181_cov173-Cylindrotheca_fusiformis.AAC.4